MSKLGRLSRASFGDLLLIAKVSALLPMTAMGVRLLGLRRWQLVMKRLDFRPNIAKSDLSAHRTARLVASTAAFLPFHFTCLHRSLALQWLLRQEGIPSVLRLGVKKNSDAFAAHAWVECAGVVMNDGKDVAERFAPFRSIGSTIDSPVVELA